MSLNSFDISSSGLYAQKIKMETIASNIANVNTTRDEDGNKNVYRRKEAVFSTIYNDKLKHNDNIEDSSFTNMQLENTLNVSSKSGDIKLGGDVFIEGSINFNASEVSNGVKIEQVQEDTDTPLRKVYNPSHPDADKDGYVEMPNVNIVTEMVDMISASRAYEANVTHIQTTKSMISAALRI